VEELKKKNKFRSSRARGPVLKGGQGKEKGEDNQSFPSLESKFKSIGPVGNLEEVGSSVQERKKEDRSDSSNELKKTISI